MIRPGRNAFTLIELTIIVATIAILAAIAVPNFLEAQVRGKIARVKADLNVIHMGLGRYYADHGMYVPNHPEVQTYLETALDNPLMQEGVTTAPESSTIPWYHQEFNDSSSYTSYEWYNFPALRANGNHLTLLTTPVAYLESGLPGDRFDGRNAPFLYINSYSLFTQADPARLNGLQGDHLTSATRYVLGSQGPSQQFSMWHPVNGPWLDYDPTNGTNSSGNLFIYEGRKPSPVIGDDMVKPNEPHFDDPFLMKML